MSTEYISAVVLMIISIGKIFNFALTQSEIEPIVTSIVTLYTGIYLLYKRYQRGGINAFGARK